MKKIFNFQTGSPVLLDSGLPLLPLSHFTNLPKMKVQAITVTLHSKHHGTDPAVLNKNLKNDIRQLFLNSRGHLAIELHSEFTKANVLHYHGVIISTTYRCAKLSAMLRKKYGYVCVKSPSYLAGWIEYCNGILHDGTMKDTYNVLPTFKFQIYKKYQASRHSEAPQTENQSAQRAPIIKK